MLRLTAYLFAILYSFVWLRIPEGVLIESALPVQRMVGWIGILITAFVILFKIGPGQSRLAKIFTMGTFIFLAYLLLDFSVRFIVDADFLTSYFELPLFILDISKYLAIFSAAFVIYYALRCHPEIEQPLIRLIMLSGALAIGTTYIFLLLYFLGFTTDNEILARSFGGYLGIWESGQFLPRIAGTAAEPQQFSIVFLTPLLLMLSPRYLKRLWPIVILGFVALSMSQSKFSVVSLLIILIYVFVVYKNFRPQIGVLAFFLIPPFLYYLAQLPTFTETFENGLESGSITERADNLGILVLVIIDNLVNGIGAGQYAVYVNYSFPVLFAYGKELPKNYYPNLDYLKILAETGIIGFSIIMFVLFNLYRTFFRSIQQISSPKRDQYLAFLFGSVAILLSMFFSYEFLHVFFWLNLGFLMFMVADQVEDEPNLEASLTEADQLLEN